ncbi:MAG: ribosome small subunit-dependent GTPase A [Eubacteriales bacterium]
MVGDFVVLSDEDAEQGIIQKVLPRSSLFVRSAAGTTKEAQAVGANIDTCFITMSLNQDFNLRRLERYLTIAWDSGATPVVVLTKADLSEDLADKQSEVESVALGVDIITTSAKEGEGLSALTPYLQTEKTVVFLGSSGVGKSTLINMILGEARIKTSEVREDDDKGRHTTTARNLIYLDNGCAVIDTPGIREVGVESGDTAHSFADIEALAAMCRFSDCGHGSEPGCAVKAAIADGSLDAKRLESYIKLQNEMSYDGLSAKQRETAKLERMMAEVGGMKGYRKFAKKSKQDR